MTQYDSLATHSFKDKHSPCFLRQMPFLSVATDSLQLASTTKERSEHKSRRSLNQSERMIRETKDQPPLTTS